MTATIAPSAAVAPFIASDHALQIARLDAEKVYGDLARYRILVTLEDDGWHVEYSPKDSNLNGGGPHYVIDSTTGSILAKKYYQ
jgi:hypothetical protein